MFFLPLAALFASANAASYAETASINGFADAIFASLPTCAQECVKISTSSTPCPYWDTGCLCVMTSWTDQVTACYAENCSGEDAYEAYELSISTCKAAGLWSPYWFIDASASSSIEAAIGTYADIASSVAASSSSVAAAAESTAAATSAAAETTTSAEATSTAAATSAAETTAAGSSSAESSTAAVSSYEGAANGVIPAAALGAAAGIAMLL